jgi:hypothetical protein
MIPIVYQYPTPALLELAKEGVLAIAGCIYKDTSGMPTHYCKQCLYTFPDIT